MKIASINYFHNQQTKNISNLSQNKTNNFDNSIKKDAMSLNMMTSRIFFGSGLVFLNHSFKKEAMNEDNPKWAKAIQRESSVKSKSNEFRSEFERDCDRIVYSGAYDRLRYKTQVFFNPTNDLVSTRSTHVMQVSYVARRIANILGLNSELAEAIAVGHDLGHSPFGHEGEGELKKICKKYNLEPFWHGKNSLRLVDKIITRVDSSGEQQNLNLSYAVRDGLICHSGAIHEEGLKPREDFIDLYTITRPGEQDPYTWEGCVMKISDNIAYLGRDIEDAFKLGILKDKNKKELRELAQKHIKGFNEDINNSVLINLFVTDLCQNSNPREGLKFSKPVLAFMNDLTKYNFANIYRSPEKQSANDSQLNMLIKIFETYDGFYSGEDTIQKLTEQSQKYPTKPFAEWLNKYSNRNNRTNESKNEIIYDLNDRQQYRQAIVDYISGMTDKYAITTHDKIIHSESLNNS